MTKRISQLVVIVALFVTCVGSLLVAAPARASEICYETVRLKVASGSATATAGTYVSTYSGVQDSTFYELPAGISYDPLVAATAAPYCWGKLTFVVTGATAANADSIRFQIVPRIGGKTLFVPLFEQSAGVTNIALNSVTNTSGSGVIFSQCLQQEDNAIVAGVPLLTTSDNSVLKVAGDPNGAFNSVEVYLTYPKRCGARGQ